MRDARQTKTELLQTCFAETYAKLDRNCQMFNLWELIDSQVEPEASLDFSSQDA